MDDTRTPDPTRREAGARDREARDEKPDDTREDVRDDAGRATGARDDAKRATGAGDEEHEERAEAARRGDAGEDARSDGDPADEASILRHELASAHDALERAEADLKDVRDRWLRARADLDNVRRRAEGERERAREAGMDSVLLPALTAYDDLGRALQAAEGGDPASIVPGVRQVREGLERQLAALGIEPVGAEGEPFDPDVHEALSAAPAPEPELADTIAQVFQVGFRASGRLVRPARVIVYQA